MDLVWAARLEGWDRAGEKSGKNPHTSTQHVSKAVHGTWLRTECNGKRQQEIQMKGKSFIKSLNGPNKKIKHGNSYLGYNRMRLNEYVLQLWKGSIFPARQQSQSWGRNGNKDGKRGEMSRQEKATEHNKSASQPPLPWCMAGAFSLSLATCLCLPKSLQKCGKSFSWRWWDTLL